MSGDAPEDGNIKETQQVGVDSKYSIPRKIHDGCYFAASVVGDACTMVGLRDPHI